MLQKDVDDARKEWIKDAVDDPDEHRRRNESDLLKVQTAEGKIVFHSLRHTFSSLLAQSGVSGGLVVHLGVGDGELTAALRQHDAIQVHGLKHPPEGWLHSSRQCRHSLCQLARWCCR